MNKKIMMDMFIKRLLIRSVNMFDWYGLPTGDSQTLEHFLQSNDSVTFFKHEGKLYFAKAVLGGERDVYENFTQATFSIPALSLAQSLKIGEECEVIHSDSLHLGLTEIFARYAGLFVESEITLNQILKAKRVPYLFSASDDRTMESAKRFLKKLDEGETEVIAENALFENFKVLNTGVGDTTLKGITDFQNWILSNALSEIGIKLTTTDKSQYQSRIEVLDGQNFGISLIRDMERQRKAGVKRVNDMFGTSINVRLSREFKDIVEGVGNDIARIKESIAGNQTNK